MKVEKKQLASRSLGRLVAKELTGEALRKVSGASENHALAAKTYTDSGGSGLLGDCDPLK